MHDPAIGRLNNGHTPSPNHRAILLSYSPNRSSVHVILQHIFDKIALADNVQYLVRASYLEIYNEEIRDLLSKVSDIIRRRTFGVIADWSSFFFFPEVQRTTKYPLTL